ncbi:MAG: peptidyl-prolyl cis-trans isomerase [Nitrospirae bacterium]|jgi:peptidyl-prolyl cis-trans isomerase C|nr:peptidyl-prolyl cis-trans isomerase [Nitrospirota bacterium]
MLKVIFVLFTLITFSLTAYADEDVVAKVNGTVLTRADLEVEVDRIIPRMSFHRNVTEEKRKNYYKKAIEEMVNRELQYQDALTKGIKADQQKIDAQAEQFKKRFITEKEYTAFLEKRKLSEDMVKKQFEKDMLIQLISTKIITEPSKINDDELKKYYNDNIGKFKQPESYRLRLISVKEEKKAQDILEKLKQGEDIEQLATTMSEDAYRVKGGDTGYIHKGRMHPELEDTASKMKIGEISDILKVQGMFYIIKLEDKKPEHTVAFDEIKVKLKKELEDKKAREAKEKWIAELKSKAKIEILMNLEPEKSGK